MLTINSFQICSTILHEKIDEEVIALDMQSGSYYSLRNTAALIWSFLLQALSTDQMINQLITIYKIDEETATLDVNAFLHHLAEEALIEAVASRPEMPVHTRPASATAPYAAPQLEIFTDVQDLLTIDPIHDVDEMGWPQPRVVG